MKVKVTKAFLDKFTRESYTVGSVLELTDAARVENLVSRGLVTIVKEPPKEEKKAKKKK